MLVIEADSQNVVPVLVDSIQIYAAQRYSFVLTADQPVDNYCGCALSETTFILSLTAVAW